MLIVIPPLLITHPRPPGVCGSLDRQHINTFSVFKLGASSLTPRLPGYRVRSLVR
jgi:hypothetical protein